MSGLHALLANIVVVAFALLTVLNILRVTGRDIPGVSTFSRVAALLLLLQYVLGFLLMGGGYRNSNLHYLIALLAIVTVGMEHGWAANRATPHQRAVGSLMATALTTVLMIAAHGIGTMNRGGEIAAYIASFF
jgi:hypothetical protein